MSDAVFREAETEVEVHAFSQGDGIPSSEQVVVGPAGIILGQRVLGAVDGDAATSGVEEDAVARQYAWKAVAVCECLCLITAVLRLGGQDLLSPAASSSLALRSPPQRVSKKEQRRRILSQVVVADIRRYVSRILTPLSDILFPISLLLSISYYFLWWHSRSGLPATRPGMRHMELLAPLDRRWQVLTAQPRIRPAESAPTSSIRGFVSNFKKRVFLLRDEER